MARPRFCDELYERREQLGISISEAARALRMREELLVAFEDGDFERIPKSGYGQGMVSSYASYLGLDGREMARQFTEEFRRAQSADSGHRAYRRDSVTSEAGYSENYRSTYYSTEHGLPYTEQRGLLPTSAGVVGDMVNFTTTSGVRHRYEDGPHDRAGGHRYTSRNPLEDRGSTSRQSQLMREASRSSGRADARSRLRDEHTSRQTDGRQPSGGRPRSSARAGSHRLRSGARRHDVLTYEDESVTTRSVRPSQYRDDLSLGTSSSTYDLASSRTGRRASRNIASTARPNVSRRRSRSYDNGLRDRSRRQGPRHGGLVGVVEAFFMSRERTVAFIGVIAFVIITLLVINTVRGCVANQNSTGRTTVNVSSGEESSSATSSKSSTESSVAEAARQKAIESAKSKTEESSSSSEKVEVKVSLEDGAVTWVSVTLDGKSKVADTLTGPWEETYTVSSSIQIEVNDTSSVTVTRNGKQQKFDSKSSGLGTITITGPKAKSTEESSSAEESSAASQETTDDSYGYYGEDGTYYSSDGTGYYSSDGTYSYSDSSGYYSSDGTYADGSGSYSSGTYTDGGSYG